MKIIGIIGISIIIIFFVYAFLVDGNIFLKDQDDYEDTNNSIL